MESKAGASCPHPSVFPPSVPLAVDMSAAPTPREAGREAPPHPLLPRPQTSPRQCPERRHSPWLADKLRGESLVYKRAHTNPKKRQDGSAFALTYSLLL